MKFVISKIWLLTLLSTILLSCKKENVSKLSDSFHLKSNGADMPVHVFGNASDKTFIILLHGGPGDNGLAYRSGKYAEELEKRQRDHALFIAFAPALFAALMILIARVKLLL